MMIELRISEKLWFRPNWVATSPAPFPRNASRNEVKIMPIGLNYAIHATMTAVNPRPPARVVVIV